MSNEVKSGSHPLPQDVFKYAPEWARFAAVDNEGMIYAHNDEPRIKSAGYWDSITKLCLGCRADLAETWRDSLTVREPAAPKLRPWRADEVPVGAVVRLVGKNERYLITQVIEGLVSIGLTRTASLVVPLDWFDEDDEWCWPSEQFTPSAWRKCGVEEGGAT